MFMFSQFISLLSKGRSVHIDSLVFWLHYRVTVVLLTAAALVVTSQEFFGQPIACGPTPVNVPHSVLDYYCWTRSTFSLQQVGTREKVHRPYPGLGPSSKSTRPVYHSYYQWVWIVLVIQAACFYFPRFLWKRQENGRLAGLTAGLVECSDDETSKKNVQKTAQIIQRMWNRLNKWALFYYACELFAFINVIVQIFIIDSFLGGSFLNFGTDVLWYSYQEQEERTDTMVKVFPRLTKCSFRSFGASGSVQVHDALCVLPLNIINEKVYVIFWFWMVLLASVTTLLIVYRISTLLCCYFRVLITKFKFSFVPTHVLNDLFSMAKLGDWFLINLLGANLPEHEFKELLVELHDTMKMDVKTTM